VWDKNTSFKKRTREVIDNKGSGQKTNPNEPKNEAEKLLKTSTCGKNKPKNKPGHVVENKRGLKIMLRTFQYPRTPLKSGPFQRPSSSTNRAARA
jgi:hypothetical protein